MRKADISLQDYDLEQVDICARCEERLEEIYPHGIPAEALRRYRQELLWMKQYHCERVFQFMTVLYELAESLGAAVSLRGEVGGSFLLYLLCKGRFNPLSAHYYCPKCGHYEAASEYRYAPDMPEKTCPVCHSFLRKDGFSIPAYAALGVDGSEMVSRWNVNVSRGLMPYAKELLKKYKLDNLMFCECEECNQLERLKQGNRHSSSTWSDFEFPEISWEKFARVERSKSIAEVLGLLEPQNFHQIMAALGHLNATYTTGADSLPKLPQEYASLSLHEQLEQFPAFYREDIYEYLLQHDVAKEEAARLAIIIGKGRHNLDLYQDFLEIPECMKEIAPNIKYLFPRAHNVERLWLDAQIILLEGR